MPTARNVRVTEVRKEVAPPAPEFLHGAARELWVPTVEKLQQMGVWDFDCELLTAQYCVAVASMREALEHISRDGPIDRTITHVARHTPWRKVLTESSADVIRLGNV